MDHDEWAKPIIEANKKAEFLEGIAEILREEGLDAQLLTDRPAPPGHITLTCEGRHYVVASDGENLIVRHVPPEVKIPLADPEVLTR